MTGCVWGECEKDADPSLTDELCVWHSEDPKKPHGPFEDELAGFFDVADAWIDGWHVPVKVDFAGTRTARKVWNDIDIADATFIEAVDFARIQPVIMEISRTTFKASVSFASSDFTHLEHLRFDGITFEGVTVFDQVTFDDMSFSNCHFRGGATFKNAKARRLQFGSCRFDGVTEFEQFSTSDSTAFLECVFAGPTTLLTTAMSRVHFARCDVAELRLSGGAFLASAEFHSVEWPREGLPEEREARRAASGYADRWYPTGDPNDVTDAEGLKVIFQRQARSSFTTRALQDAERLYRELRRSADNHRYWQDSSYFYKRELEMRRLAAGPGHSFRNALRRNIGCVEGWFALLSDYGTSLQRPLAWLGVLLLVVYPTFFAALGVTDNGLVYRLAIPPSLSEWLGAQLSLVALSTSMAALMPASSTTVLSPLAQLAVISLRVIGPLLAFLITLAIRTRFRR